MKQRFFWVLASFSLSRRPLRACSFAQASPKRQNSSLPHGYSFYSNALVCGAIIVCAAFLFILTGCVGYVDPGGGGVVVTPPEPDFVIFGGDYDRGHDVHAFSHRGFESRGAAHGGGGGHRH